MVFIEGIQVGELKDKVTWVVMVVSMEEVFRVPVGFWQEWVFLVILEVVFQGEAMDYLVIMEVAVFLAEAFRATLAEVAFRVRVVGIPAEEAFLATHVVEEILEVAAAFLVLEEVIPRCPMQDCRRGWVASWLSKNP